MEQNFGQRLKELRKTRGLTQVQLAKELGLTERQYQRLEANDSKPMYNNLVAISNFFEVSLDHLIEGNMGVDEALEKKITEALEAGGFKIDFSRSPIQPDIVLIDPQTLEPLCAIEIKRIR